MEARKEFEAMLAGVIKAHDEVEFAIYEGGGDKLEVALILLSLRREAFIAKFAKEEKQHGNH